MDASAVVYTGGAAAAARPRAARGPFWFIGCDAGQRGRPAAPRRHTIKCSGRRAHRPLGARARGRAAAAARVVCPGPSNRRRKARNEWRRGAAPARPAAARAPPGGRAPAALCRGGGWAVTCHFLSPRALERGLLRAFSRLSISEGGAGHAGSGVRSMVRLTVGRPAARPRGGRRPGKGGSGVRARLVRRRARPRQIAPDRARVRARRLRAPAAPAAPPEQGPRARAARRLAAVGAIRQSSVWKAQSEARAHSCGRGTSPCARSSSTRAAGAARA